MLLFHILTTLVFNSCQHADIFVRATCNIIDPWFKVVLKQLFAKKLFQNHLFKTLEKITMEARL